MFPTRIFVEATGSPFNTPMTVAALEQRCRADNVDIKWGVESWDTTKPSPSTMVMVDDEKHGIWTCGTSGKPQMYVGRCIVWGGDAIDEASMTSAHSVGKAVIFPWFDGKIMVKTWAKGAKAASSIDDSKTYDNRADAIRWCNQNHYDWTESAPGSAGLFENAKPKPKHHYSLPSSAFAHACIGVAPAINYQEGIVTEDSLEDEPSMTAAGSYNKMKKNNAKKDAAAGGGPTGAPAANNNKPKTPITEDVDTKGNVFHAILTKYGFTCVKSELNKPNYLDRTKTSSEYRYENTTHGRSYVSCSIYPVKDSYGSDKHWILQHEQPNGIMAPTSGDTKPQLAKTLAHEYGAVSESWQSRVHEPTSVKGFLTYVKEDISDADLEARIMKVMPRTNTISASQIAEKVSLRMPWGGPDAMAKLRNDVVMALSRLVDQGKVKRDPMIYPGGGRFSRADKKIAEATTQTVAKDNSILRGADQFAPLAYIKPKSAFKPYVSHAQSDADWYGAGKNKKKLQESENAVNASDLGFKPIKGRHQRFAYPTQLSYGGRAWSKQMSGGEHWDNAKTLAAVKYSDQWGNVLRVNNNIVAKESVIPPSTTTGAPKTKSSVLKDLGRFFFNQININAHDTPDHPLPGGWHVLPVHEDADDIEEAGEWPGVISGSPARPAKSNEAGFDIRYDRDGF